VWRATFKSLFARKVRLGLTALSIVLGIGFVAGSYVLTDTMGAAFDQLFKTAATGSDVIVRSVIAFSAGPGPGGAQSQREPVPSSVTGVVGAVPGVASVTGIVSGYAQMIDPATGKAIGGVGPPTFGINWTTTNPSVVLRSGRAPSGPAEVVVDAATAAKYHLSLGQSITIVLQGPPRPFTIVGVAGFGSADNLAGATVAFFDTATAQDVLNKKGVFDELDVVAAQGVTATDLRSRIQQALPKGTEALTSASVADEQAKTLKDALGFFQTILLVFAYIALFVGSFIIFNTFSIIVAQRTKELALLRALGASRRQVLASVVGEAFVTGLVASAVGVAAGVGIAAGLKALLKGFGIDLPSTSTVLRPRTVVVSLVAGTVVTLVACILPAWRASKVAPVEAMRDDAGATETRLRGRLIFGGILTAVGAVLLAFALFGHAKNAAAIVGAGAAAVFVGVATLAPFTVRPVAGTLARPIARLGIQGKLGRQNSMRNPRRTASTAAALMVGLGLVTMVSILSASLKASTDVIVEQNLKADLLLTSSSNTPFSPDVATNIEGIPGVGAVSEVRQGMFRVNGKDAFLAAVDPETIDQVVSLGLSTDAQAALGRDRVVVLAKKATENGWKVGDSLLTSFSTSDGHPLIMGGTFTQNQLFGGDYLISLATYRPLFTEQLDSVVLVKTAPGSDTAALSTAITAAIRQFGNIKVQDQAAFRASQAGQINTLLGLVTALLAMAIVIALFGIVNTLGLSIFERRRELGLLRAVGMGRGQVKRMIRWESVIIAILGAVLGICIGGLFGVALRQALDSQGVTELAIPVGQLAFALVFAALAGVIAAIWPARRAAKLNVLEAISYE
jgi:putative ABC transport system permease protein